MANAEMSLEAGNRCAKRKQEDEKRARNNQDGEGRMQDRTRGAEMVQYRKARQCPYTFVQN